jgi:hypothetical protein
MATLLPAGTCTAAGKLACEYVAVDTGASMAFMGAMPPQAVSTEMAKTDDAAVN